MSGINVLLSNRRQQVLINQATPTLNLDDLLDVDVGNKVDGSILVYNATTQVFEATLTLTNQIIDGGSY